MKLLNGSELADYIKERQAKQVRALRQADHVLPNLAIVQTIDNPVIDAYVRLKQRYGADILIGVDVHKVDQSQLLDTIKQLNGDPTVHGIIVQLPLADESMTDEAVNTVTPEKDVDGLGMNAKLDPATPLAINWLVAGYNINFVGKKVAIIGEGRLVGAPLAKMWRETGYDVTVFNRTHEDMLQQLPDFDVIVTAAGAPALVKSDNVKIGAVVIDAGTAAEHGKIVGDVAEDVRHRDDLTITPEKGGVGPLTVAALFDNVIQAARATVPKQSS
jgi:methylenetetrahydrofolate dehydrogenase (NADP+) / methenyltetrahydrofolate cyclohydrolase